MEQATREIERELSWREGELASIRLSLHDTPAGSPSQRALLRAAWGLLYAHYEGFVKYLWDTYLEAIQSTGLPRSLFTSEVACYSLESAFRRLRKSGSSQEYWQFAQTAMGTIEHEAIGFEVRLPTNSNLWPDLLEKNCDRVSLRTPWLGQYKGDLWILVDRRNQIAHGQKMEIKDLAEYERFEQSVLTVMYEMALAVDEAIEKGKYLKQPSEMPLAMGIP